MYKILTCVGLYETFTQHPCLFWRHEQLCFSKSISVHSSCTAQFIQRSLCDVKPANIRKLLKGTHLQTITADKQFFQFGSVYFKEYQVKMKQHTVYVRMYVCMYVCMYGCMDVRIYIYVLPLYVCMYVHSYVSMQACICVSHSRIPTFLTTLSDSQLNQHDKYLLRVYRVDILLMMDGGPLRNMQSTLSNNFEKQCIQLVFVIRI